MTVQLLVGLEEIRRRWFLYLLVGLVLLVLGIVAVVEAFAASLTTVVIFGWLLIFSGLTQAILAAFVRQWSGFFLHLLGGILEIVVGVLVVGAPVDAALGLTLLLAVYLLVGGLFRMIAALLLRFPGSAWAVLGGLISFLLGLALWRQWPMSGLWFIGTCVGIALLLHGASWIAFALSLRKIPH
jgi:uncharacterized membrane protein HdeD (DUF308 family)